MSDTPTGEAKPRSRNWVKILLIISLSINLLIAGAVISRFVVAKRMISVHGMSAPGLMLRESRYMMRAASSERRLELRQVSRPHRDVLRRSGGEISQIRMQIAALLKVETLNKKVLREALQELNASEDKAHEIVTNLRQDFLLALTFAERKRFAEGMLSRRGRRGPGGPGRRRGNWNNRR